MERQDFLRRALVVFTLGPLTLVLIYFGGWFYFIAFAALLSIAVFEFSSLLSRLGMLVPASLVIPLCILLWLSPDQVQQMLIGKSNMLSNVEAVVLSFVLLVTLAMALWLYEKRVAVQTPQSWMAALGVVVLMGWLGSHFFRLRGLPENAVEWTTLTMLSTWIADSGAYVFGKTLGKHKLAPRLSPNKTIEGYIGGIISGTLFTVLIGYFMNLPLLLVVITGLLISIVSPLGDLGVSLLKRAVGVKDSGNLLPGHGGAFDRIDSLMWSVTLVYYLVYFLG
jgi:phosphatidate cytidylyltransferase